MPTKNPRVMLTLPPELDQTFAALARLEGKPKTKVIVDYLASVQPHAKTMIDTLEALKQKRSNPVEIIQAFTSEMLKTMGALGVEMDETMKAAKAKSAKGVEHGND